MDTFIFLKQQTFILAFNFPSSVLILRLHPFLWLYYSHFHGYSRATSASMVTVGLHLFPWLYYGNFQGDITYVSMVTAGLHLLPWLYYSHFQGDITYISMVTAGLHPEWTGNLWVLEKFRAAFRSKESPGLFPWLYYCHFHCYNTHCNGYSMI